MICWHDPFRLGASAGYPSAHHVAIAAPSTSAAQRLLQLLGGVKCATIKQLCLQENVTAASMYNRLQRLIASGLVEEAGPIDSDTRGPRPMTYRLSGRLRGRA